MSRLRIISLAHRATWSDVICQDAIEKICSLNERSSSCWLSLNENPNGKKREAAYTRLANSKEKIT
jgi:hypothetical protein